MYDLFKLPDDFLHREYTDEEKQIFDGILSTHLGTEVKEELTDKQKAKVDSWGDLNYHVKIAHSAAFGNNDRDAIDTDAIPEKISSENWKHTSNHPHTVEVMNHLHMHGYVTDDYHSGLAYETNNPKRKLRIGEVLKRTGGEDVEKVVREGQALKKVTLSQMYERDPERKDLKNKKQIVFTKNKYDVAGMSTDRPWTSCMNIDEGCNKRYLKHDIHHGTITAYLVNHGDDGLKRPIGRINLKRFTGPDGHVIYRPESRSYGTFPKSSVEDVDRWAKEKFPSKPGIYVKHHDLYDDDGKAFKLEHSESNADKMVDSMVDYVHRKSQQEDPKDFEGTDPHSIASSLVDSLPEHHLPELAIHTAIHRATHYGYDEDKSQAMDAVYDSTKNAVHHKKIQNHINDMSAEDAFKLHTQIHNHVATDRGSDHHTPLLERIHTSLANKILTDGSPEIKDSFLSDVFSEKEMHKDYYRDTFSYSKNLMDDHHPLTFTTNPRIHHTLLDQIHDSDSTMEMLKSPDHELYKHLGKHADEKLAHRIVTDHIDHDSGDMEHFVKGLNENPHGEHIQHKLTSEIMFHDGHNTEQQKSMELQYPPHLHKITVKIATHGIHGTSDEEQPLVKEFLKHRERNAKITRDLMNQVDPSNHEPTLNTFWHIGKHTAFDSVKSKLKNRPDVSEHPEFGFLKS